MASLEEFTPDDFENEIPYTFILAAKELILLASILFIGFSGFSLCYDKILNTTNEQDNLTIAFTNSSEIEPIITIIE